MGQNPKRSKKALEFEEKDYDEIHNFCKDKKISGFVQRGILIALNF